MLTRWREHEETTRSRGQSDVSFRFATLAARICRWLGERLRLKCRVHRNYFFFLRRSSSVRSPAARNSPTFYVARAVFAEFRGAPRLTAAGLPYDLRTLGLAVFSPRTPCTPRRDCVTAARRCCLCARILKHARRRANYIRPGVRVLGGGSGGVVKVKVRLLYMTATATIVVQPCVCVYYEHLHSCKKHTHTRT